MRDAFSVAQLVTRERQLPVVTADPVGDDVGLELELGEDGARSR